jgi:hypothetical protein
LPAIYQSHGWLGDVCSVLHSAPQVHTYVAEFYVLEDFLFIVFLCAGASAGLLIIRSIFERMLGRDDSPKAIYCSMAFGFSARFGIFRRQPHSETVAG